VKIIRHGDNLVQITRFPLLFPINCYLVREDEGWTLIDTGIPRGAKRLLAIARELGAPIVRIALTHAHLDHAGSLDALARSLPDAEILVGARDARFLAGDRSLDPGEPRVKLRGNFAKATTHPTRTLVDGDMVGSLRVVAAPGHTPGQIAFYDTRDGSLIAGDAFQTRGGLAVAGVIRPLFPFPVLGTWHLPTALATAETLRELNPSRLAVGHGAVLERPADRLDAAIATARAKVGAREERVASV
jgi:glyoxylase-like metal-dependent hydrolase (beta-lactamase superfamily II)